MPFYIEHETCVGKQIYAARARTRNEPRAQTRASMPADKYLNISENCFSLKSRHC